MTTTANPGPLPYIPSVYAANTYGADLRALGATKVVPSASRALELDVTFRTNFQENAATQLVRDTIGAVKLVTSHELDAKIAYPPGHAPTLDASQAAKLIGKLDGVIRAESAPNGKTLFVEAKNWDTADRLTALLRPTIAGQTLQFAVPRTDLPPAP